MPREKWFCPWHHCVQCGKPAVAWCMHCPNAYCKTHNTVLRTHAQLRTICDEHEDDLEDTLDFYKGVGGVENIVPHPNVPLACLGHLEIGLGIFAGFPHPVGQEVRAAHLVIVLRVDLPPTGTGESRCLQEDAAPSLGRGGTAPEQVAGRHGRGEADAPDDAEELAAAGGFEGVVSHRSDSLITRS